MMYRRISREELAALRDEFKPGVKVMLDRMDDPFRDMPAGLLGRVICVDDMGTIHVDWENKSSLGVIYGEDKCHVVAELKRRDNKLYHPCAVYIDMRDRRAKKISSYESELSLADCEKVIQKWERDCNLSLIVAFAQIYENGKQVGVHEFTSSENPEEQFQLADDY